MAIVNDTPISAQELSDMKTAINTATVTALTLSDVQAIYDYFATRQQDIKAKQQRLLDDALVWYASDLRMCERMVAEGVTGARLTAVRGIAWEKYDLITAASIVVEQPPFARP